MYPTNKPKRDYQFEIVQACFTDNCLVALPTGLGKTFVAGVVMLNCELLPCVELMQVYRWYPTGKIVFLAPTKPLVNQQIEACQMTCGIPSNAAAVMTGSSVSAAQRAKMWASRRVFYCTPQTLDNDLKNGSVDPRDIVLAVFGMSIDPTERYSADEQMKRTKRRGIMRIPRYWPTSPLIIPTSGCSLSPRRREMTFRKCKR